jgi:NADPH:quinone reductase-like Zn-dependent oxidoreductase
MPQLLVDEFGINPNHIFYSRDLSFAKGLMRVTQGYGVDVALNSLSGEALKATFSCMAPFGRFIEIGKSDIMAHSPLPMTHFARNVSFSAVDGHAFWTERPHAVGKLTQEVLDMVLQGTLRNPYPIHKFPVGKVLDAFRYMQSGKNTGRILVTADPHDEVSVWTVMPFDPVHFV